MRTSMPNEYIVCVDCGTEFEFTERDQEYYREREFTPPKRCKPCRVAKKARFGKDGKPQNNQQQDQYQSYNE